MNQPTDTLHYCADPTAYYTEQEARTLESFKLLGYVLGGVVGLLLVACALLLSPEPATPAAPAADVAGVWRPWSESVNDNK